MRDQLINPMLKNLIDAVEKIKMAERMAPAGSYDHYKYVSAAVMISLPAIKAFVDYEENAR